MKQKAFFRVFAGLSFGGKIKLADASFKANKMGQVMDIEKVTNFNLLKENVEKVG